MYVCLSVCSMYVRLCVREIGYIAKISVKRVSVMVYTYNGCVCKGEYLREGALPRNIHRYVCCITNIWVRL